MSTKRIEFKLNSGLVMVYEKSFSEAELTMPAKRKDLDEAVKQMLEEIDRLRAQPPIVVEYDDVMNDLAWKMNDFLIESGTVVSDKAFNNMKIFLRDNIQEWVDKSLGKQK